MFEGIDFGKLFSNRPGDPYHQGPLTESRIAEAEKVLGYHFPKSYVAFLEIHHYANTIIFFHRIILIFHSSVKELTLKIKFFTV